MTDKPPQAPLGRIVVSRGMRRIAMLLAYGVILDGKRVGGVRRGEELGLSVAPGLHVLRATTLWSGSPEVQVEVDPGEIKRLIVMEVGDLVELMALSFTRDGYLTIVAE